MQTHFRLFLGQSYCMDSVVEYTVGLYVYIYMYVFFFFSSGITFEFIYRLFFYMTVKNRQKKMGFDSNLNDSCGSTLWDHLTLLMMYILRTYNSLLFKPGTHNAIELQFLVKHTEHGSSCLSITTFQPPVPPQSLCRLFLSLPLSLCLPTVSPVWCYGAFHL